MGAAVVFAGICVEAWVKRKGGWITHCTWVWTNIMLHVMDVHAKRVVQEKEKAEIKSL